MCFRELAFPRTSQPTLPCKVGHDHFNYIMYVFFFEHIFVKQVKIYCGTKKVDKSCTADLSFKLLPKLLGFVLFEVVHYHHGGVDLPNCHVRICEGRRTNVSCHCSSLCITLSVSCVVRARPLLIGTSRSKVFWGK